jgi:hypothetical protein
MPRGRAVTPDTPKVVSGEPFSQDFSQGTSVSEKRGVPWEKAAAEYAEPLRPTAWTVRTYTEKIS